MWLRRLYPDSRTVVHGDLRWRGQLKPSSMSAEYTVTLRYWAGARRTPVVHVVHPLLERHEGKRLPHVFNDGSLCLYYPKRAEWRPTMRLADTIVPWASEWLYFYESWVFTGEWGGGGHEGGSKTR